MPCLLQRPLHLPDFEGPADRNETLELHAMCHNQGNPHNARRAESRPSIQTKVGSRKSEGGELHYCKGPPHTTVSHIFTRLPSALSLHLPPPFSSSPHLLIPSTPHNAPLPSNLSIRVLRSAALHRHGVPGVLCYNLETLVAYKRAAENKQSPLQILLFPWALDYADEHFVNLASDICRSASVPMSLHLDHAQSEDDIRKAARTGKFDSIMVDMSHFSKKENLARTRELVAYCHGLGIAVEAEPGRINGGEAGQMDTGDLEGILTTPQEALEFVDTGIDFLAPAIGNVHGMYGGTENVKLDYERLEKIRKATEGNVNLVMHGTNEFDEKILRDCVKGGMTRLNVNQLVLQDYEVYSREKAGRVPLTEFMEEGSRLIQDRIEWMMDCIGSTGRAGDVEAEI